MTITEMPEVLREFLLNLSSEDTKAIREWLRCWPYGMSDMLDTVIAARQEPAN